MEIKELLPDTGRRSADFAAEFVKANPAYLPDMIELSFSDDHLMAMRASRVLIFLQEKEPDLINPHLNKILEKQKAVTDSSAKRNLTKLYIGHTHVLNEEQKLMLIDLCFDYLKNPKTETGTKAYSLEVLHELTVKIPEMQSELLAIIELHYDTSTMAFKSKADKIKASLYKKAGHIMNS